MQKSNDQIQIKVRVTPGAKRNAIVSQKEGVWYVKVAAPPVEGRANEELISYLSRVLDIRKSAIAVILGQNSRAKTIAIAGASLCEVEAGFNLEVNG